MTARAVVLAAAALNALGCTSAPKARPTSTQTATTPATGPLRGTHPFTWFLEVGRSALLEGEGDARLLVDVERVRPLGGGRVAGLRWTLGDAASHAPHPLAPSAIGVGPTGVHLLDAALQDADIVDAITEVSAYGPSVERVEAGTRGDGRYVTVFQHRAGGDETIVCLGEGPGPGAAPCEDVCFSELCVSSTAGVVSLSGLWAPESQAFYAPGYRGFEARLEAVRTQPR